LFFLSKISQNLRGKLLFDTLISKYHDKQSYYDICSCRFNPHTWILIASGVSILDGLSIIIETATNMVYQNAFKNIYKLVKKDFRLEVPWKNRECFLPFLSNDNGW
jgi:type II secretory pathway component PulF